MNGWTALDDNGHGGSLGFVAGPTGAPLGSGSAQLKVSDSTQGYMIFKSDLGGTKLSDLSTLSYKTYIQTGNNLIAPTLQLNIDRDVTDTNTSWQGRLVYEPYMNGSVNDGQWQAWNAEAGKWWITKPASFDNQCGQSNPCTISELTTLFPNIGVNDGGNAGVGFKAGSSWTNFTGNVDAFTVNNKTYDFDQAAAPTGLKFTANNLNGAAVSGCDVATNNVNVVAHWDAKGANYNYRSWTNAAGSAYNSEASAYSVPNVGTNSLAGALSQGEGDYWFEVQAIMANGDLSLWSAPCKITYDKTAPAAPTLVSPGNNTVENGVTLVNKWSSVGGATKYVYQSYNNAAATAVRSTITTTSTEKTANNVVNGTVFWWRVKAIDAQGNESAWSGLWKVTIDSQAPSVPTGGTPNDMYRQTNEFDFDWNDSTDNNVGPITYEYRSSKDQNQVGSAPDNSGAWTSGILLSSMIHSSGASDGTWYWQVRAIDAIGNKSAWSQVWNMTIDQVNPQIQNLQSSVNKHEVTWIWTGVDPANGSGIDKYSYQLTDDAGIVQDWTDTTNTSLVVPGLDDGTYVLHVRVTDKAGRTGNDSKSATVDVTGPVLTINTPTLNQDGTYRVTGTTDTDSPVAVMRDGVVVGDAALIPDASGNTWTWVRGLGSLTAGESYTIKATQDDGNVSNSVTATKVFAVPAVIVTPLSVVQPQAAGFAAIFQPTATQQTQTQPDDSAVLGAQTLKDSAGSDIAAIAATPQGWKIFGIAWYWILIAIIVLASIAWWAVAAAKRRTAEDV
jgi:hypothetical protein